MFTKHKNRIAISLLWLLLFFSQSVASFQKNQWNADEYVKHSKSQQEDALALLKNINFIGNERILDVGCGDGRFTLLLTKNVPNGIVIGIDPSDSMIKKANTIQHPNNLMFIKDKAETFSLNEKFDLIIAIHAMHWVKDQKQALKNIYNHLAPNGKIYFILAPSKEGLPFDRALKKTLGKWNKDFVNFENNQYFYDVETYRKLLADAGYHINNICYTYHQKNYRDKLQLTNWVKQWLPHYKYLSIEKKELFVADLIDNYLVEIEAKPHKDISWGEYVMQVEATKLSAGNLWN